MAKYIVHYGVRLTCDMQIEADSYDDAVLKANEICEYVDYDDMNFAEDDIDIWDIKE